MGEAPTRKTNRMEMQQAFQLEHSPVSIGKHF